MRKPTKKQIEKEIKKLKDLLPNIRAYSMFGTDNRTQLSAQIDVLEGGLDNAAIFDHFDHTGIDEEVLDAALAARQWLDGMGETKTLSEDWAALDRRKK